MMAWVEKEPELKVTELSDYGESPAIKHSVMCWLCDERSAIYAAHPQFTFKPCWECQKTYGYPLVKAARCLLSHDWGSWQEMQVEVRAQANPSTYSDQSYEADVQRRVCGRCGYTQQRFIR
jgi:hypothetical protein